jgi:hypothetical protein
MTRLAKKTGRPKRDFANDGLSEDSGFWDHVLARIGKKMTRGGYMTPEEWREFAGPSGPWKKLKDLAGSPGHYLSETKGTPDEVVQKWFRAQPKNVPLVPAIAMQKWFCAQLVAQPKAVPLFMVEIVREVEAMPRLERWLHNWRLDRLHAGDRRSCFTDAELAELFTKDTKRPCSEKHVARARENIGRRIKKHVRG